MSGILVAGIGNIFQGDDGFGVEVVKRLAARGSKLANVKIVDFGIRGLDLVYALLDGYDAAILIDAAARGCAPGTLSIVEPGAPDCEEADSADAVPEDLAPEDLLLSAHDLHPGKVLKLVSALEGRCKRILLLACEPRDLGGEDGLIGLSPPVAEAVERAADATESLIAQLSNQEPAAQAA